MEEKKRKGHTVEDVYGQREEENMVKARKDEG